MSDSKLLSLGKQLQSLFLQFNVTQRKLHVLRPKTIFFPVLRINNGHGDLEIHTLADFFFLVTQPRIYMQVKSQNKQRVHLMKTFLCVDEAGYLWIQSLR